MECQFCLQNRCELSRPAKKNPVVLQTIPPPALPETPSSTLVYDAEDTVLSTYCFGNGKGDVRCVLSWMDMLILFMEYIYTVYINIHIYILLFFVRVLATLFLSRVLLPLLHAVYGVSCVLVF